MTLTEKLLLHRFQPEKVKTLLEENAEQIPFCDIDFIPKILTKKLPCETLDYLLQWKVPFRGTLSDLFYFCLNNDLVILTWVIEKHLPPSHSPSHWQRVL